MKVSDMIFQANFFLVVFGLFYFIAERFHIVPIITLTPYGQITVDASDFATMLEEFIILLIIMNVVWIGSQIVYWKVIRKEAIVW